MKKVKNPIEKCWFWREEQEQEQEIPSQISNVYMPLLFFFFLGVGGVLFLTESWIRKIRE